MAASVARPLQTASLVLAVATLLAGSLTLPLPQADPSTPDWFSHALDPAGLRAAVAGHPDKVPAEFHDRLQYANADGSLIVMVVLADRSPAAEALATSQSLQLEWYGETPSYMALVTPDQVRALLDSELVTFVEPDYPLTFFMSASTVTTKARSIGGTGNGVWYWDTTTGTYKSDVTGLATPITGDGVRVAVIDGGIDQTYRDFSDTGCTPSIMDADGAGCPDRIVVAVKLEPALGQSGMTVTSNLPTTDLASGHGTHVSGTIAGNGWYSRNGWPVTTAGGDTRNFGMAPEAELVVVTNGETQSAALATNALNWARLNVPTYGIRVTSNSWGCDGGCAYSAGSATDNQLKLLYQAGVVNVFAVGNNGGTGSGTEFSGYAQSPWVLGVAAHDRNDRMASFSSRGSSTSSNTLPAFATWNPTTASVGNERRPDVAAPGVNILSALASTTGTSSGFGRVNYADTGLATGGLSPYVSMSGTSMATPHVSGALALLIDACPAATALELMRAIMAGADGTVLTKTGSSVAAQPFEEGYGKLDARASLDWLRAQLTTC